MYKYLDKNINIFKNGAWTNIQICSNLLRKNYFDNIMKVYEYINNKLYVLNNFWLNYLLFVHIGTY